MFTLKCFYFFSKLYMHLRLCEEGTNFMLTFNMLVGYAIIHMYMCWVMVVGSALVILSLCYIQRERASVVKS